MADVYKRQDSEELFLVIPFVQRLGLVQPLVALQADEAGPEETGDGLRQLRLTGPGRPLDEHRLAEPVGEIHHAGEAVIGQVGDRCQAVAQLGNR